MVRGSTRETVAFRITGLAIQGTALASLCEFLRKVPERTGVDASSSVYQKIATETGNAQSLECANSTSGRTECASISLVIIVLNFGDATRSYS